jgi:two-component system, NarL family, invasion response regulator UvrY
MATRLRVLIADDHAILRAGIVRLLREMPEVEAIGEADSGNRTLQQIRAEPWNVLLLDLDMPGQSALDVLRMIKASHPEVAALILSMYPEEQFALRALKAGAAGYVNKESAAEQLVTAIRLVGSGSAYISARVAGALAKSMEAARAERDEEVSEHLSDREFTVLRALAAGKSITEIARGLNLSAKTVSTYRTRLLARLQLHSNVELARYATARGLVK